MVLVRKATEQDVKDIVDFFSRMYRLNSEFDPLLATPADLEERVSKTVEKSLQSPDQIIIVAEENKRVVGVARVIIYDRMFYVPEKEAVIEEFYVYPSYRRQGVGKEIVDFIEKELKERGIELLSANFPSRNLIAVSFYKKMGFREIYSKYTKKV